MLHLDSRVDADRCAELIRQAGGMQVTLRAFDRVRDPLDALETKSSDWGCTGSSPGLRPNVDLGRTCSARWFRPPPGGSRHAGIGVASPPTSWSWRSSPGLWRFTVQPAPPTHRRWSTPTRHGRKICAIGIGAGGGQLQTVPRQLWRRRLENVRRGPIRRRVVARAGRWRDQPSPVVRAVRRERSAIFRTRAGTASR